ncbi:MAG: SDR family oxidoreductase [Candidatus Eremiobacteraeota bacterium]|nr:SDR family oxidoreductase [Candidatus Eremiobacteraeota bacterium]
MILVTGATGTNGVELIERLVSGGAAVRAMVRNTDAIRQRRPGVDYVAADFDDPASIRRILNGVDSAFLVTNSSDRVERQQLDFVQAAREAGLSRLVYLSQLHAAADSPVRFLRYHAQVERAIERSEMRFTHLRPNLYMQSFLGFAASIESKGQFFAPIGDSAVSVVDVRDIASVAAKALTEPGHDGKSYDLTGPEALTHAQIAAQLSAALGRPVAFIDVPEAAMRDALVGFGMPPWQADGLIEDYAHYRRGEAAAVASAILDVTGTQARSFADFARDYAGAFAA